MNAERARNLLRRRADEYFQAINEIAGEAFEDYVMPWLNKTDYRLSVGMGAWSVRDVNDEQVDRDSIPDYVLDVLELSVPLYDHELGSCMPEWPED